MNREERKHLLAERATLTQLLADTPTENVLERESLSSRLQAVMRQLDAVPVDEREPARARLTFRGRPVVGSYGIFAEFGTAAIKAFADTVAMLAAGMSGPLADLGRIPGRNQNQLLITRTAIGSFGFELEEHREQALLLDDESSVALALAQTQELLESTAGSDDELTEAAAGIDPRVLNAVRGFLETLATNEAVCTVEYGPRRFSFRDVAQVREGAERLKLENVHEQEETHTGEFQGVLPKRRTFEFKLAAVPDTIITGKIGPNIVDPDALNRHLHQRTTITVASTRLGNGRPRFVLKYEPQWTDTNLLE